MASVTIKEVSIARFKLSNFSLESIIKAGCNSDRIRFFYCSLDLKSDIDISGPDYKTTFLSFRWTGNKSLWVAYPCWLKRILKAISLSSLKTSLQTLDVWNWGLEESKVEEMLKEFNLEHVKVIFEENGGYLDE